MVLTAVWMLDDKVTMWGAPPGVDLFEFAQKHLPAECVFIESDTLPSADQDFYNAWSVDTVAKQIIVRLAKAKEITKDRLRVERKPLLEALDVTFIKALETGVSTAPIVAEKQRLRDITLLADACTTTAELRALKCANQ